jgi:hypothetical protein
VSWWNKSKTPEDIVVQIDGHGEYKIPHQEVIDYFNTFINNGASPSEDNDVAIKVARIVAINKLKSEFMEKKLEIENDINALQKLFDNLNIELKKSKSKSSRADEWKKYSREYVDPGTDYDRTSKKMDSHEMDDFLNSFLGEDFVERMKEEEEHARKRQWSWTNTKDQTNEQERMKENANFWNNQNYWSPGGSSSWSDWRTVLEISENETVTKDLVNKKFRKLALKHHPDHGGDEEEFKKLLKAKEDAYLYLGV